MKFRLNVWLKNQSKAPKLVYMIKDYKNKEPWI